MSFFPRLRQIFKGNIAFPADIKYHGLFNQGATCYLNSVLQVLFMTKDFREAVERSICKNPDTEFIDSNLKELFEDLKKKTASTCNITKKLGINRVQEQRDAAEYMEKILCLASPNASQIFKGLLTHKYTCSACHTATDADAPFWSLPLVLVESDSEGYDVMDAIKAFLRPSDISGDNQLYCEWCDAKADATVKCEIKEHPEVLTLLLKRFKFDDHDKKHVKTKCRVEIPYTLELAKSQTYELYACVEHFGDLRSGHYTATIKSQDDKRWYNFNDAIVKSLDYQTLQVVKTKKCQSAYLLFYRKQTIHAADTSTQDSSVMSLADTCSECCCILKLNDSSSPNPQKHCDKKSYSNQKKRGNRLLCPNKHYKYSLGFFSCVFVCCCFIFIYFFTL